MERGQFVLRVAVPFMTAAVLLFAVGACSARPTGSEQSNQLQNSLPTTSEHPSGYAHPSTRGLPSETGNALETEKSRLPVGGQFDYQLGGPYAPDDSVQAVGRDREAAPAEDLYSVCYVNAFQTQPSEEDLWNGDLLLRQDGEVLYDPNWPDEAIVDTSTSQKRQEILAVTTPWIEQCAIDGYQGVEFDNLDSYARSQGLLSFDDNLALAQELVDAAHANGLAAGQKNAAEHSEALHEDAGFDFALTESCAYYGECGDYAAVYGSHVLDVEYSDEVVTEEFQGLCKNPDSPQGMVLRDRDLVTPDDPAYVFVTC